MKKQIRYKGENLTNEPLGQTSDFTLKPNCANLIQKKRMGELQPLLKKKGRKLKKVGAYTFFNSQKNLHKLIYVTPYCCDKSKNKKREASVQGGKMHIHVSFF